MNENLNCRYQNVFMDKDGYTKSWAANIEDLDGLTILTLKTSGILPMSLRSASGSDLT